jgi:hypothetical protein
VLVQDRFDILDPVVNASPDLDELESALMDAIRAQRELRDTVLRFDFVVLEQPLRGSRFSAVYRSLRDCGSVHDLAYAFGQLRRTLFLRSLYLRSIVHACPAAITADHRRLHLRCVVSARAVVAPKRVLPVGLSVRPPDRISNDDGARMFLTPEELALLTGRRNKSCQVRWLRANGIAFRINASGRPVVASAAVIGDARTHPETDEWCAEVLRVRLDRELGNGPKANEKSKPSA